MNIRHRPARFFERGPAVGGQEWVIGDPAGSEIKMPETARRNLTPRIARMLRELEGPAAAMMVPGDAMEAKRARRKRGPVLPPPLAMPAGARR